MYRENPNATALKAYTYMAVSIALLSILIIGYYNVQITESEKYQVASKQNIIREFDVMPTRGDIYDRKQKLLVDNRPAFSLYVNRDLYRKDTLLQQTVYDLINDSTIDFNRLYKKKYAATNEVLLKRHISPKLMSTLIENKSRLPGIYIKNDPVRNFHQSINGAHILGTLREVSQRELESLKDHKAGDFIGYEGLEKFYNTTLYGSKGTKSFVFDALGNQVSEVDEDIAYDVPEIDGKDIYTSIDARIQFVAESLLVDKKGAIIA